MRNLLTSTVLLVLATCASACASSKTEATTTTSDAAAGERCGAGVDSIVVDKGVTCCPYAPAPTCDCMDMGGSPDQPGGCGKKCDQQATEMVKCADARGCRYWKVSGTTCSGTKSLPSDEAPASP